MKKVIKECKNTEWLKQNNDDHKTYQNGVWNHKKNMKDHHSNSWLLLGTKNQQTKQQILIGKTVESE